MLLTLLWIIFCTVIVAIVTVLVFLARPVDRKNEKKTGDSSDSPGGIITIRHVGTRTKISVIPDYLEGQGEPAGFVPTEAARDSFPELYEEYMSPETSATRKYEIADYIYSIGLTLPLQRGMYEQFKREVEERIRAEAGQEEEKMPEAEPVESSAAAERADPRNIFNASNYE